MLKFIYTVQQFKCTTAQLVLQQSISSSLVFQLLTHTLEDNSKEVGYILSELFSVLDGRQNQAELLCGSVSSATQWLLTHLASC